ncbi:MAG: phosphopyruvate hydratase [Candidatus Micrarchaeota archaeon]|nr:phosphopyruvate hydratase [Candidatus Micrarchaeota archaeon]
MSAITRISACQVLDSRGYPTLQVEVFSKKGYGKALAPSGASTGKHEAVELRDGGKKFEGKGVQKAIANVLGPIAKALKGLDVQKQEEIDQLLCSLDGTPNKSRLGANATTAVSLAVAQCAASESKVGLYRALGRRPLLPCPFLNVINGGKHSGSGLSIQEFMLVPAGFAKFSDAIFAAAEVYHSLGRIVARKYGKIFVGLGDEGGFAPPCKSAQDALSLLEEAVSESGYSGRMKFAIDAAASSFYNPDSKSYAVDGKVFSCQELHDFYVWLASSYPIVSIEDPFEEDSFEDFALLRKKLVGKAQIVGDDLFVTNAARIEIGIKKRSASALLLKVNQVGTLTEALQAAKLCHENKMGVIVSHRSGETEDSAIADIAVGIGCGQIKAGAPARSERTAKYNRLLQIEQESGCKFAGGSRLVL